MTTQAGSIASLPSSAEAPVSTQSRVFAENSSSTLFLTAIWFALVAGFVEGLEFLLFQRINWAGWARQMHAAKQLLWISPVVDLCFFLLIAAIVARISRAIRRMPAQHLLIFLLAYLTAYDWLMVTGRLYRRSCVLLALGIAAVVIRWFRKHDTAAIRVFRRSALWLVACLALVFVTMEGTIWLNEDYVTSHLPPAAPGSPNVLVIILDTLRADHVSSYGYGHPTSPNIDQIAQQGVLFENAFAASSWSLPSHASLLTGRTVHETGWGNIRQIPWLGWRRTAFNGLPTLGEAMQKRGYRTAAFSANSVYFTTSVGMGRGFIHFEDYFENVGDAFVRTEFGREFSTHYMNRSKRSAFTRAFHAIGLSRWLDKDSEGSGVYGGAFGVRKRADEVNSETLRWIEKESDHPFLAFLNYFDVHYAYGGPENFPQPSWAQGTITQAYDAGLQYDDEYVGKLLHRLGELGILQNTVVIITSDHGESMGDHGLSYHGAALYFGLIHVPLIISYPGHIPQGVRVEQPVSNANVAETVMDLVGDHAAIFPGPSLAEFWKQPQPDHDWPDVISELPKTNTIVDADLALQAVEPLANDGSMRSVITPQWQLIQHEKKGDQIYDWRADPKESRNLINTPEGQAARDGILARAQPSAVIAATR